jgi:hypothetical protein
VQKESSKKKKTKKKKKIKFRHESYEIKATKVLKHPWKTINENETSLKNPKKCQSILKNKKKTKFFNKTPHLPYRGK